MNQGNIIEIDNLKKTFPASNKNKTPVEAVKGLTFNVKEHEVFGLLGPNGAGKTTTMRMLCTLLVPTSGRVLISGEDLSTDPAKIRLKIGYVSQVGGMQRESTGRENLMLQAKLYGMSDKEAKTRIGELLSLLSLGEYADRKTSTYSGGQRRIFDLACGIVHRPEILFLDEPSTGLDPQNRVQVWEQVKKLQKAGTTVILTTHYLDEADALSDRVAIIDRGVIVAMGRPEDLKSEIAADIVSLGFSDEKTATISIDILKSNDFVKSSFIKNETAFFYVNKGDENLPVIIKNLQEKNIHIKNIGLARPTLDDVFLKITGRTILESEAVPQ
jgi:ABC-2 type transport system ATP-binding protein